MQQSIRHLQFEGILCVAAFCHHFHISHPDISKFINHRIEILRCPDIVQWSSLGHHLPISGLGDPLPDEVARVTPDHIRNDFERLMDSASEIGVCDLYGANTDQPSRFLLECISILSKHNISSPVEDIRIMTVSWGDALADDVYEDVISRQEIKTPFLKAARQSML